jgi:hypothetical protein
VAAVAGGGHATQLAATPLQTGVTSVGGQTLSSTHAVTSSLGTELHNAVVNPADGVATNSGHHVLSSTPTQLEVGVFDGTHGWLQIRAEMGTSGTVNASLTTSSAAHDAVKAAVPEMSSYLQSEALNVSRIAVHRIAEMPNAMNATTQGDGQQSGGAQGQHTARDHSSASQGGASMASGSDTNAGSGAGSGATSAADELAVGAVDGGQAGSGAVEPGVVGAGDWMSGASALAGAAGGFAGGSGRWLNVQA